MTETVERTTTGAILYDRSIINQISDARFLPGGWAHAERLCGELGSAGRGNTFMVGNVPRQFVLKHYLRGGLLGKLVRDRYVWAGADETRSFAEWRMLAKMAQFDLPVPRPAAARYVQHGTFYSADIITVRIPGVRPLSQLIAGTPRAPEFWANIGAAVFDFHHAGVYHADMNAYNIQIDTNGKLWMLDFDKGRLREPGPWQQATLARLHRSLKKICSLDPGLQFHDRDWSALLEGYFNASRSA
ncbi:MAG TPA: 3-deoxy-D-manno-octulosonic acid kinase [Woeseiaceae bacterium]|nr:3-deoxy-D-manno-octulosonic acid kinase [Woeseiaceae bacterium]